MELEDLGWKPVHEAAFRQLALESVRPGRVTAVHAQRFAVRDAGGEWTAALAGHLRDRTRRPLDSLTIGDWVAFEPAADDTGVIRAILPRRTLLVRKTAGRTRDEQPLAANVDRVLIVMGLDGDYNVRRLERTLVMVAQSGARALIVLNKSDLDQAASERRAALQALDPDVPVLALSARHGHGLEALTPYVGRGETVVLIGSSGAGKSTLANRLLGEERQSTGPVREHDDRGRHTTTARELVLLPSGAVLIDTPGLREIQLTGGLEVLDAVFDDVRRAAEGCRFRDCRHEQEPGCAVRAAVESGAIDPARLANLQKLQGELAHQAAREDPTLDRARKAKWKSIHKQARQRRPRESD
jgi:ribosome biogenesis GTPase / thiamine phosphate phosphatase